LQTDNKAVMAEWNWRNSPLLRFALRKTRIQPAVGRILLPTRR
jgi:hypothetical protein